MINTNLKSKLKNYTNGKKYITIIFRKYENNEKTLYVALMNRNPNDILRTIAHELTHYKQDTEHELVPDSGRTGSPHENEAHAIAGIVMRHFNKKYPEYLSGKPITE
jgi:hypothetical protein